MTYLACVTGDTCLTSVERAAITAATDLALECHWGHMSDYR